SAVVEVPPLHGLRLPALPRDRLHPHHASRIRAEREEVPSGRDREPPGSLPPRGARGLGAPAQGSFVAAPAHALAQRELRGLPPRKTRPPPLETAAERPRVDILPARSCDAGRWRRSGDERFVE